MSEATASERRSVLYAVPFILLGAVSLWALATWFRREYNHDDFFFAYLSWIQTTHLVPVRDYFVPAFAVLPQLAAPIFRLFPESFLPLDLARIAILLSIAGVTVLVYRVSRAIGASRSWAAVATLLWLCHPDVVFRMADMRTDAIAALFLLAAALAILRVDDATRATVLAGLAFGVALVISFKVCLAAPFLMIGIGLWMRKRALIPLLLFSTSAGVVLLADYAWNIHVYGLQTFLEVSKSFLSSAKTGRGHAAAAPMSRFLTLSPVTAVLLVTGLLGLRRSRRGLVFAVLVCGYIALTIAINPFLFPYNSLLLIPLLAPIASGTEALFHKRSTRLDGIVLAAVAVLAFSYAALAMGTVSSRSNARQKDVVRWIWKSTAPNEHVFDWQGMHFGRPGIVHWWNFSGLEPKYLDGWYSLESELRQAQVTLAIANYRLRWMKPEDGVFFTTHFVHLAPCLYTPGAFLPAASMAAGKASFDVFVPGDYHVVSTASVQIDGAPAPPIVRLSAGQHIVSAMQAVDVALYYTTPLREGHPPPCPAVDDPLLKGFD